MYCILFFFQAEDGIRDLTVTGVQTCALPISFLALPRARREALYAVYAFCRTVDDIADLGTDAGAQRVGLAAWRRDIARCYEAGATPEHPIARQLATAVRQFGLPRAALEAIVEGCEMDLQRSTYETFEDLAPS